MLTCAACGVARYSHADCQQENWDCAKDQKNSGMPRHRHLCPLWQHARDILQGKAALHSSSFQQDMRIFLQACKARLERVKTPLANEEEKHRFEKEESFRIELINGGISCTLVAPSVPPMYIVNARAR